MNSRSIGSRSGPEQVGQHVRPGLELGVAVGVGLDDLGVDAERGVVDEHAVVDAREIDAPLDAVGERVERAHDVVAVEAEVEREVVARSRRDADVGDVAPGGDRRHERLRAVAAGHPDDLRAARDRALGELEQVIAALQDDRLDAPLAGLGGEVEALGLAAAGLQVDDQHRRVRLRRRAPAAPAARRERRLPAAPERVARGAGRTPRAAASSATSTTTPCQLREDYHEQADPASAASAAPAARRVPRRVSANQIAALQTSTSATASTATSTSPASAIAAITAIATGASSATIAARRALNEGPSGRPPASDAGGVSTIRASSQAIRLRGRSRAARRLRDVDHIGDSSLRVIVAEW